MDTTVLIAHLESAVADQVVLAGNDRTVEKAAQAILDVARACLSKRSARSRSTSSRRDRSSPWSTSACEVVVSDGEPSLRLGARTTEPAVVGEDTRLA